MHYLRDLGQRVSHEQCSASQPTGQQRDNEGKSRSHIVPTAIHQLIQQLHLPAGTLQLGDMLQATEGEKLVTTSSTKSLLRERYARGWIKWEALSRTEIQEETLHFGISAGNKGDAGLWESHHSQRPKHCPPPPGRLTG